jgi:hypothetical protein
LALVLGLCGALLGTLLHDRVEAPVAGELGFTAILIGMMVAIGVRLGAGGVAHWGYRLLSLVVCYSSIAATFVPEVLASSHVRHVEPLVLIIAWASAFPVPLMLPFDGPLIATGILGVALYAAWRMSAPRPFSWGPPSRRGGVDFEPESANFAASALLSASHGPKSEASQAADGPTIDQRTHPPPTAATKD